MNHIIKTPRWSTYLDDQQEMNQSFGVIKVTVAAYECGRRDIDMRIDFRYCMQFRSVWDKSTTELVKIMNEMWHELLRSMFMHEDDIVNQNKYSATALFDLVSENLVEAVIKVATVDGRFDHLHGTSGGDELEVLSAYWRGIDLLDMLGHDLCLELYRARS